MHESKAEVQGGGETSATDCSRNKNLKNKHSIELFDCIPMAAAGLYAQLPLLAALAALSRSHSLLAMPLLPAADFVVTPICVRQAHTECR